MAFTHWESLKKIDAHIHILPDAVHKANPDSDDVWLCTDIHGYCAMMDDLHIEKAVIMPLNDPWLMSMEFTIDAVHRNLRDMKNASPGRFYAFADIDTRNTPAQSAEAIRKALDGYGLDGIKIHPNNTRCALDDEYNAPIFALAQQRNIPVAIHSYPNSAEDVCAAKRIGRILERYPDLRLIVAHTGGAQWEELLDVACFVDMSAILPDYVRAFGIAKTEEILRSFGADRLLFATDYPDNRHLPPVEIYAAYFDILNRMDFTEEEAVKIAYTNMRDIMTASK